MRQFAGQTSLVSIQNTDTNQLVPVLVKIYPAGGTEALSTKQYDVEKGTSITLDLDNPDSTLPIGFLGSLTAESYAPLAVQSVVYRVRESKALYALEGMPDELADRTVYAPLVRNGYFGTTGIAVVAEFIAADVTLQFTGTLGTCAGQTYAQGPVHIPAGVSVLFYQGNVAMPDTGTSPLPEGCAGSARISASQGLTLAVVNDAGGDPSHPTTSAAYDAVPASRTATKVALPLVRNGHTAKRLTTGIVAMNTGNGPANVMLTIQLSDGTTVAPPRCRVCQVTIPAGQTHVWYAPSIPEMPSGTYGSAFLESDQSLAVVANEVALSGTGDSAAYSGLKADLEEVDTP